MRRLFKIHNTTKYACIHTHTHTQEKGAGHSSHPHTYVQVANNYSRLRWACIKLQRDRQWYTYTACVDSVYGSGGGRLVYTNFKLCVCGVVHYFSW